MPAARVNRPQAGFDEVRQIGEKALNLAMEHRAKVEPRLEAGVLEKLRDNLDVVGGLVAETIVTATKSKAATAKQNEALAKAAASVSGIRTGILKRKPTAAQRKGYGISTPLQARSVPSVVAAAIVIIDRATEEPEEARSLGILESDVAELRDHLVAVGTADDAQEKTRAKKPATAAERNRAAQRIADAVRAISGAGILAFRLNPELRAAFDALDDGLSRNSNAKTKATKTAKVKVAAKTAKATKTVPTTND